MGKEIERKFLIKNEKFKKLTSGVLCIQGFLSTTKERIVRVRIMGEKAFLTIKGISKGATRAEFEYEIPVSEAQFMLDELCEKPIINKYRYKIPIGELIWEVDVFFEKNEGLIVAEVEVPYENKKIEIPDWIGREVTGDQKYYNSNLVKNPYSNWD